MPLFSVDRDLCKRDAVCVSECPARIIEIKSKDAFPEPVDGAEALCINCGHCVAVCPHGAMSHSAMTSAACSPVTREILPSAEQVDHFLRSRRSIRTYKAEPLDRETLARLIDVARYAPSGHNYQPVYWLVIEQRPDVKRLAGIVIDWMKEMIAQNAEIARVMHFDRVVDSWGKGVDRILRDAPHLVVAYGRVDTPAAQPASIIALTYLELAAYSLGLGACWAGYFNIAANLYKPMQDALSLAEGYHVFGGMMLGHAKYKYPRIPLRKDARVIWR
jgi:nitroreductase/NAD-dependent dihydropyrimidine dehydrogenase PreA subunit